MKCTTWAWGSNTENPSDEMDLVARENEILRLLNIVSKSGIDFIVVGGYAVSAHAKHRFSVDCDLVAKASDLRSLGVLLEKEGFDKRKENDEFDEIYGGRFIRYVKKINELPVSIDLLINSLVCRQTGGSWSYDYVSANSVDAYVPGIQESVRAKIPTKELLMAFKLHSGRRPDVRDVVMLGEEADWKAVLDHMNRGSPKELKSNLKRFIESLEDKRLIDSLKGEFTLHGDVGPRIRRSTEQVQKILDELDEKTEHESSSPRNRGKRPKVIASGGFNSELPSWL